MDRKTSMLPSYFISHGSPDIAIRDTLAAGFLRSWGETLPEAKAILVVSAHWMTSEPMVTANSAPETIHDFGGFPRSLYQLRYPTPGNAEVAAKIVGDLTPTFPLSMLDNRRGLDHGAWIPLLLALPEGQLPVLQLSIQPHRDARHHYEIGKRLQELSDRGVLMVASGNTTHNLRVALTGNYPEPPEKVLRFSEWLHNAIGTRDDEELLNWQRRAPDAAWSHPTDDHLLPLFTVLGASAGAKSGKRLHTSIDYGVLAMDAYEL